MSEPASLRDACAEAMRRLSALAELPLAEAIARAADALHGSLGADAVALWLRREGAPPTLVHAVGLDGEHARALAERLNGGAGWLPAGAVPGVAAGCLHAPLRAHGAALGGLAVAHTGVRDGDLPIVAALADAVGLLAASIAAADTARREAVSSRLLRRVATAAASLLEPDALLRVAFDAAREALRADGGAVYVVDGDALRLVVNFQENPEHLVGVKTVPLGGGYTDELLHIKGARQWTADDNPAARAYLDRSKVQVVATAVIAAAGSSLGLINLVRRHAPRFTDEELELLANVGALVGPAVAAAERLARTDAELGQRGVELNALRRVADTLGRTLDLREVVERCLDFAEELVGADNCTLHLYDENAQVIELVAHRNLVPEAIESSRLIPRERSEWLRNEMTRNQVRILHFDDPGLDDKRRNSFTAAGTRVAIIIPLLIGARFIGLLSLGFLTRRTFTTSTMDTLLAIGEQEAVALDRARAHEKVELRAHLSAVLRETAERALTADGLKAMAEVLLDGMLQVCGGSMARLSAYNTDGEAKTVAARGIPPDLLAVVERTPLSDSFRRRAATQGSPQVISSAEELPADATAAALFSSGVLRSLVLLPLRAGGRLLGTLSAPSREARRFKAEELEAMRLLQSLAATALQTERLRRHAEAERRRLGQLVDRLPFPIAVASADLTIERANAAYRALTGISPGERQHIDQHLEALQATDLSGAPLGEKLSLTRRALRGEEPEAMVTQFKSPHGLRTVQVSAVPLREESGDVSSAVVALQDITELRELADAKDRFLAVASHELRGPIASLQACLELLEIDPSAVEPARRGTLLGRVRVQTNRLGRLVDDLVESARVRADSFPIEREWVDLTLVVREAVDLANLQPHHQQLVVDAPEPVEGEWDRHRLMQVVTNLVSNAIRYSPDGGEVAVSVRRDGEAAVLAVRDHGIGIPPSLQRRVFDPFVRGREASGRAPRGLGLGLFITQEIVRRHGGRISVASELGRGSTFTVVLPIRPPA